MNILCIVIFVSSIVLDQILKCWADLVLKNGGPIVIIDNFFQFIYVENKGAAFGMLQNKMWFLIIVTIAMVCLFGYILFKNKNLTNLSRISLTLISGGAVGNLIDRIRLGYVIDYINVTFGKWYDFPVFNLADSCVVVGTVLLLVIILCNKLEKGPINE